MLPDWSLGQFQTPETRQGGPAQLFRCPKSGSVALPPAL